MTVGGEALLNEIASDLVAYLKEGKVNFTSFAAKALPELSAPDLDRLLRIHFVLTKTDTDQVGVLNFVEDLPGRLQRIRTTVEPRKRRYDGEVHGRIQWNRTLQERYSHPGSGPLLFVCDEIERNYETAENLVLKAVIEIIVGIVQGDLTTVYQTAVPTWLGEWAPGSPLREDFLAASSRNVYLRRIECNAEKITDATIVRALRSRHPLYREAAALLARYRRLMRHDLDETEARQLFADTFIRPAKDEVLFELYWVIRVIQAFRRYLPQMQMHPIQYRMRQVAKWTLNGDTYEIYHNSTGNLTFYESAKSAKRALSSLDNYFGRMLRAQEEYQQLIGGDIDNLWGGRPDLVLEVTRADGRRLVLLGEVKYTNDPTYAKQGLRELLDYVILVRKDGRYVTECDGVFKGASGVRGCLFTDKLDRRLFTEAETLHHLIFGDRPERLDALVLSLLEPSSPSDDDQNSDARSKVVIE